LNLYIIFFQIKNPNIKSDKTPIPKYQLPNIPLANAAFLSIFRVSL